MDSHGHMIVDGVLADNIADITGYIDQLNQQEGDKSESSPSSLSGLAAELKTAEDPTQRQEAYFALAEASGALLKAPLNEFEPAFNLLIYVLTTAPDFAILMPVILSSLTNGSPESDAKQVVILGVLGNLFNILPETSAQRADVFVKIIDLATASNTVLQLVSQLDQVVNWLGEWQCSDDTKGDIVLKLYQALKSVSPVKTFDFLQSAVAKLPNQPDLAEELAKSALTNSFTCDFSQVLISTDKYNQKELQDTMIAVSKGDVKAIPAKYSSVPEIASKARLLAIPSLASQHKVLKYDDIAAATGVDVKDVEKLVIDATKAKLVHGRLNQFSKEFTVLSSSAPAEITDQHWQQIEAKLQKWKTTLMTIQDTFVKAESDSERVTELNKLLKSQFV